MLYIWLRHLYIPAPTWVIKYRLAGKKINNNIVLLELYYKNNNVFFPCTWEMAGKLCNSLDGPNHNFK